MAACKAVVVLNVSMSGTGINTCDVVYLSGCHPEIRGLRVHCSVDGRAALAGLQHGGASDSRTLLMRLAMTRPVGLGVDSKPRWKSPVAYQCNTGQAGGAQTKHCCAVKIHFSCMGLQRQRMGYGGGGRCTKLALPAAS